MKLFRKLLVPHNYIENKFSGLCGIDSCDSYEKESSGFTFLAQIYATGKNSGRKKAFVFSESFAYCCTFAQLAHLCLRRVQTGLLKKYDQRV